MASREEYQLTHPAAEIDEKLNKIDTIEQQLADLLYKAIAITSFVAKDSVTNSSIVEIGSKVTSIAFQWSFNKRPESVTFNGTTMPTDSAGTTLNASITSNSSWSLEATDERGARITKSSGLTFLNGVYYGSLKSGTIIDSIVIRGLSKSLQDNRKINFTVTSEEKVIPIYALPTRYGTPTFKIGDFEYEWNKVATFEFTNASGHKENYDVWIHNREVTGNVVINVV